MKNFFVQRLHSLRFNVTIKLLFVIIVLSTLLLIFLPLGLRNFFLEESYQTIERSQQGITVQSDMSPVDPQQVNHIPLIIHGDNIILPAEFKQVNESFLSTIVNHSINQADKTKRYVFEEDKTTIYYVITKNDNYAIISYVYGSYVEYYIDTLYKQLFTVILIVFLLTLLIAVFLANNITNPLILISKQIKRISKNNWEEKIKKTRKDEIGDIQNSLELMRQHLKTQDKNQREMFQNISHDLKTPIMIIEGYSQSILDGYVQEEEIPETMASIIEEAKRLEKKVKSLLYINKIDQLSLEKRIFKNIDVLHLLQTVVNPYQLNFQSIQFIVKIESEKPIKGEFDEWRVAIENIIDNMTRFASSKIMIHYKDDQLVLFNDGPPINETVMEKIFQPYGVGVNSNFGLGLAITQKVVHMYGYHISVHNEKNGVKFIIYK